MHVVVGAGWYGCRVAECLEKLGEKFCIIDTSDEFFRGSSSKNQNRLHMGFHYPRCSKTRLECVKGFQRFMECGYPSLSFFNFYAVSKRSLVDFNTYCTIFRAEGTNFKNMSLQHASDVMGIDLRTNYVDGDAILCDERYIDFHACGKMFRENLEKHLLRGGNLDVSDPSSPTLDGQAVDHVFDCTYGQLVPLPVPMIFEVCVSLVYRYTGSSNSMFAITFMDGPFFSIFPYNPTDRLYTMTHVAHTPMQVFGDAQQAQAFANGDECRKACETARTAMEAEADTAISDFVEKFDFVEHFVSIKAKFADNGADDRSLRVFNSQSVTSFVGGKITGAFEVDEVVARKCAACRE